MKTIDLKQHVLDSFDILLEDFEWMTPPVASPIELFDLDVQPARELGYFTIPVDNMSDVELKVSRTYEESEHTEESVSFSVDITNTLGASISAGFDVGVASGEASVSYELSLGLGHEQQMLKSQDKSSQFSLETVIPPFHSARVKTLTSRKRTAVPWAMDLLLGDATIKTWPRDPMRVDLYEHWDHQGNRREYWATREPVGHAVIEAPLTTSVSSWKVTGPGVLELFTENDFRGRRYRLRSGDATHIRALNDKIRSFRMVPEQAVYALKDHMFDDALSIGLNGVFHADKTTARIIMDPMKDMTDALDWMQTGDQAEGGKQPSGFPERETATEAAFSESEERSALPEEVA